MQGLWNRPAAPPSKPLDEAVWRVWVEKGRTRERRNSVARQQTMTRLVWIVVTSLFLAGVMPAAAPTKDLSRYRGFRFGANLATIAKQANASPSQAKVIQRRPGLIQELEWRPQPLGPSSRTESVSEAVFSFYDGQLFRIAINYNRYETEGLTGEDFIEAISATYGIAERAAPAAVVEGKYGDPEEVIARWQDSEYDFHLIRSSYGPTFRLVGALKRLEALAESAMTDAKLLDAQEAPQREAARIAGEKETERAKLEKSRLVNKPKFRP
jgi:hypothetical protein